MLASISLVDLSQDVSDDMCCVKVKLVDSAYEVHHRLLEVRSIGGQKVGTSSDAGWARHFPVLNPSRQRWPSAPT